MPTDIMIRPMQPEDGSELAMLYVQSPDTGSVTVTPRYLIDPYVDQIVSRPTAKGVVAVAAGGGLIGAGVVVFETRRVAGEVRSCALLSGLVVHPAFRGQGVATRLTQWRIAQARECLGPNVILLAGVQHNNARSLAVARHWMNTVAGVFHSIMVRPQTRSPRARPDWRVRPATAVEWAVLAQCLNRFYADYEYAPLFSAESLPAWLHYAPTGEPLRTLYVVVDADGKLLAGCGVSQSYRVREMYIERLPNSMRLINWLMRVVPPDGIMRPISVSHLWYQPGHVEALRYLWETLAWQARERANAVLTYYDPRSQLPDLLRLPRWLPKGRLTFVTWQDQPSSSSKRLFPPI